MRRLRKLLLVLAGLGFVVCVLAAHYYYKDFYRWKHSPEGASERVQLRRAEAGRLQDKALELKGFLAGGGQKYNSRLAFLVDMRLPSGRNRFFVYDLDDDAVLMAGLVVGGKCQWQQLQCAGEIPRRQPLCGSVWKGLLSLWT